MIRESIVDCPNFLTSEKNPVYFIAEIGGNHEGNFDKALEQLELAIEANVDAVKFQIYYGDKLVSPRENKKRNEKFSNFALERKEFEHLARICEENNTDFLASIWDQESLDWADELVPFHKIGSGDLTAFPLIREIAKTGKPILLSTGLSTLTEIERTVDFISDIDSTYVAENKLVLLQCNSAYPTPDEDANVATVQGLEKEFNLPVGYSDHTFGPEAAYLATLNGASVLEMHFTDTREDQTFRDHDISIKRDEVGELMDRIRRAAELLGNTEKQVTESERESGHVTSFRRSIYAAEEIEPGEKITGQNTTVLRPEHGIPAWKYDSIIGNKLVNSRKQFQVIREEDIQ